jgi:hypothetical protein
MMEARPWLALAVRCTALVRCADHLLMCAVGAALRFCCRRVATRLWSGGLTQWKHVIRTLGSSPATTPTFTTCRRSWGAA